MLGTHPSDAENYFDTVLAVAQASEAAGLDAVFYSDHFQSQRQPRSLRLLQRATKRLQRRMPQQRLLRALQQWAASQARKRDEHSRYTPPVLECFTTLAAIAAATDRIRLGALVAGVPYRNPALLAKMYITLDVISHGRCIVGLGAGWYEEEFRSHGWPFPPARERLDALEDAVQIVMAMMTQRRASYVGKIHSIDNALNKPLPVQRPRPPILIGGSGEKRTLRLVARYADYCNIFGDPATVKRKLAVLRDHCEAIGRPYEDIIPSNFVGILIGRNQAELARKRRRFPPWLGHPIIGTPDQVIAALQAFVDVGIRYVVFNLADAHTIEPIHLFAECVIPAFSSADKA